MGDSIKFTIGGQLGPSYRGALSQAVAESKAANQEIHNDARKAMSVDSGIAVDMSRLGQFKQWKKEYLAARAEEARLEEALRTGGTRRAQASSDAAYDAALIRQNGLIKERVAQIAAERAGKAENDIEVKATLTKLQAAKKLAAEKLAITAKEAAEEAAIREAENLKMLTKVSRGYGSSVASGGSHGHGGLTGIIRESFVIMREISMGRGLGRIAGSVTLLAQYLGLLGKVVKSTASESVLASAAESKLAQSMAASAVAAKGKAAYAELAAAATAQEAIAAQAAADAEIALASATVTVNPFAWIAIGVVVAIAAFAGFIWHTKKVREEWAATAQRLGDAGSSFSSVASEIEKSTDALREHARWLEKLMDDYESMETIASDALKTLEDTQEIETEKAKSRGDSEEKLRALERQHLIERIDLLTTARNAAAGEEITAKNNDAQVTAAANSPEFASARAELESNQHGLSQTAEIIDDLKKQLTQQLGKTFTDSLALHAFDPSISIAGSGFNLTSKAGGGFDGTLDQAMTQFQELASKVSDLKQQLEGLDNAQYKSKSQLETTTHAHKELERQLTAAEQALVLFDLKSKIKAPTKAEHIAATEWERAGLGGSRGVSMLDIGKLQLTELKGIHTAVKGKKGTAKPARTNGVNYGDGLNHNYT